ncbi:aminotransferase class III-fold pyridoxal phosphate-dependent enzyme [Loktanella sp. DJP18]|uniref:aminotransferase class III-fold pyridoxal phosphate-dependent enzyme n=1 Tax=Loktanella sp. DJP18 TaxID=3409788 RepID=UPI003BB7116D
MKMVSGKGCTLHDENGTAYLDFLSQYGALPFGHNPDRVWSAILDGYQDSVPAMVQPLRPVIAERLAARLAEITPGDLAITTFTNSGAETIEAAIKLARIRTGRQVILSTTNGFHGKTLGALSATGKPMYQAGTGAPAPDFDYLPYGDIDALESRLSRDSFDIAAFIVEPIQGEGGVICPPPGYIDAVIATCRAHGVLSIIDEIQTGLGRTGALFACSAGHETPDMLLLSKALGGGIMPIGACIVRPDVWDDHFGQIHSSTFANNNIACLAAEATIELLTEDNQALVKNVARLSQRLHEGLRMIQKRYPSVISEVRGRGFMAGICFADFSDRGSATLSFASLNGGVIPLISSYLLNTYKILTAPLFNATRVLRLQPPLVSTAADIDRALNALDDVCSTLAAGDIQRIVAHLVGAKPAAAPALTTLGITVPAAPCQAENDDTDKAPLTGKFAFLIHYTETADVVRSDPSFAQFSDAEIGKWLEWVKQLGPGPVRKIGHVRSKTGTGISGTIMSVPMLPADMQRAGRAMATEMIQEATRMAAAEGATRVGLGAYTSIVTRGGEKACGLGVPVTSGNTLTSIAAVKALIDVAARCGVDIRDAHVAVVGATGAIGRLASLMLSRQARHLTLIGNGNNPFAPRLLEKVRAEIVDLPACRADVSATTDIAAIRAADLVIVATSSEITLVDPRSLRPGTIVCDVARPPNVSFASMCETGVFVFDGGLIAPPFEIDLGPFQTLPENLCWGCLGETMLLTLAGETADFSIGSQLSLADADHIAALADVHGFVPAPTQWYGALSGDAEIELFRRARQARQAAA